MKTLKIILIAAGAILLCYGIAVVSVIGAGSVFNLIFIIAGLAISAVGYFIAGIAKWNRWLLVAICAVVALCLINFTIFEIRLISEAVEGSRKNSAEGTLIVLGASVNSEGSPKREFAERLKLAGELCTDENVLILTGGKGSDEPLSEAQGAYNYLESRGLLNANAVYLEEKSTSTYENLQNALEIIKQNGGSENDKITIVSSAFHLFRAKHIAEKVGFTDVECAGADGLFWLVPFYCVREYAAYIVGEL